MGVGDRHSRRADKSRIQIPALRSAPPPVSPAHSIDDRELDDEFSAWDDDDAGAHRPSPTSQRSRATAIPVAPTRIARKPAPRAAAPADPAPPLLADGSSRRLTPLGEELVDPVAMRDIMLSRAHTIDDPLTTRALAELARKTTRSELAHRAPPPQRADREAVPDETPATERATVKIGLPKAAAAVAAAARSGNRTAARSPEAIAAPSPSPYDETRDTHEEIPSPNRRGSRRPIARDEPFRKR